MNEKHYQTKLHFCLPVFDELFVQFCCSAKVSLTSRFLLYDIGSIVLRYTVILVGSIVGVS